MNALLFKGAVAGLLALLLVSGYKNFVRVQREQGRAEQKAVDDKAVAGIKAEARAKYDTLLADWLKAATALRDLKDQQEKKDAEAKQLTTELERKTRALAAANNGRLRDPAAKTGGRGDSSSCAQAGNPTTPVGSGDDKAEGNGLLSKPLTELLLSITAEADAINTAYASCRADAFNVRGLDPQTVGMPGQD